VTCISVNAEIVHGIPGDRVLADGDLVSVDFGVSLAGWHGDSAVSVVVGTGSPEASALSEATRQAMWDGIAAARIGGHVGDIAHAVESSVRAQGRRYGIVAEYTGHGIGTAMHQPPDVPNLGRPGRGELLSKGICLAVEPMVTLGSAATATLDDEWTVVTRDGSLAAHWEHTFALTPAGIWVLTAEDGGEAELTARGAKFGPLGD
jgi:methionyl aminopeptidase